MRSTIGDVDIKRKTSSRIRSGVVSRLYTVVLRRVGIKAARIGSRREPRIGWRGCGDGRVARQRRRRIVRYDEAILAINANPVSLSGGIQR